jgi:hypothetical protein
MDEFVVYILYSKIYDKNMWVIPLLSLTGLKPITGWQPKGGP